MTSQTLASDAAIMQRLIDPRRSGWSEQAALAVLKLGFSGEDQARASELADKANSGALTADEESELGSFLRIGTLVDLMQSKARLFLRDLTAA
jgi:hypothetical protein